ncbi:MAG: LysR family transcriptional regulator [Paenibacillaceae bacterium]|jgi:DNA-binding transcriptional LysR family regulator|nr:LysR family transcriptional regulator [Paenibacillaceae bacterium]
MDIRQLRYFLAIAEEGQISSAAKKLSMAQPPLSQQLKLLEEELGIRLVERGPRSIQLTDAGAILRNRAQEIVELTDAAAREMSDLAKGMTGTLNIGTVSSSGEALLKAGLAEFHKAYSGVKYEIREGNTFAVIEMLNRGIVEVGIVRTPFKALNLDCKYAAPEPMTAVMTAEADWCPDRSVIELEELEGKPLIIYHRFESLIRESCLKRGFEPVFFCRNDDARTTLHWANEGLGTGLVPRSAFNLGSNSNLLYKEINCKELVTSVAVIWVRDKYISSLASKFIEAFH